MDTNTRNEAAILASACRDMAEWLENATADLPEQFHHRFGDMLLEQTETEIYATYQRSPALAQIVEELLNDRQLEDEYSCVSDSGFWELVQQAVEGASAD